MRAAALLLTALAAAAPAAAIEAGDPRVLRIQAEAHRTFEGAWFTAEVPADFTPRPSLESATGKGHDSVFFDAPGGAVSFYAYVPQWGGEPADIAPDPEREMLVDRETRQSGDLTWEWWTISARDGSGFRSYLSRSDAREPTREVVGIHYRSLDDLARYRGAYRAFRDSITRYAD